ncbi:PD-(D/E)XK nuclease family protein [Okeania sp. SIO2B3]|uniref:PD-(D/E)XK nuclease family protein n=1 Tax=Okeania sp. SIO2B3 TaxID=2607784 RepID=UPI0013BF597E|nr:PD-(D/E)XK nuclease family protein [Okeania sp. SIO2B3]NET46364.1 PD-(D/E)XK nuclease family protein [Okeania sp. SIO2B3]
MKKFLPFASYNLLLLFQPPVGREHFHCDMKRGFTKVRKEEPKVKALLEDNTPQRIGLLAQKGVYEFHEHPEMFSRKDGVEQIAEILQLNQELAEVQQRVLNILKNYHQHPFLLNKKIIQLSRGDEGFSEPILMEIGDSKFNFYAAIDCIFQESDDTLHILDFKTGKSDIDRRQGYLYLLTASYLYPQQKAVASFYNLDTCEHSELIRADAYTLEAFAIEMKIIAKKHQEEKKSYYYYRQEFSTVFRPNPGIACNYCPFKTICKFSVSEVSV